jgi:hypothetical protein
MNEPELLVQQFVLAVARLTSLNRSDGERLLVPSFGDVEAAIREHYKMVAIDRDALVAAVHKAAWRKRPDEVDTALTALVEAHAQELLAKQLTAFMFGEEVGRATVGVRENSTAEQSGSDDKSRSSR